MVRGLCRVYEYVCVFCFLGILIMIMVRILRKDIVRYNRDDDIVSELIYYEFLDLKGKKLNFK